MTVHSAKLSVGYLVVGITRELSKEFYYIAILYILNTCGPCYNNVPTVPPALKAM